MFDKPEPKPLLDAIDHALALYAEPNRWKQLIQTGMQQDFSWTRSAATYLALYTKLASRFNTSSR